MGPQEYIVAHLRRLALVRICPQATIALTAIDLSEEQFFMILDAFSHSKFVWVISTLVSLKMSNMITCSYVSSLSSFDMFCRSSSLSFKSLLSGTPPQTCSGYPAAVKLSVALHSKLQLDFLNFLCNGSHGAMTISKSLLLATVFLSPRLNVRTSEVSKEPLFRRKSSVEFPL
nr:hypothetical protein [Crepidula fornicata]